MKKYKDLDLHKLRIDNDLDFAHFTYQSGQCSCCYGPKDLPKRYWRNGVIPEGDDYTYILFKNADNGSGTRRKVDMIEDYTCIEYDIKDRTQLENICLDLQRQLGPVYRVLIPKDENECIVIRVVDDLVEKGDA